MSACPALPVSAYVRREPERTVLHAVVREHLNTFLATNDPPRHVRKALRGFVDCGVLAKGFVRVRCPDCREESLVAFSCKDRTFCPSCTGRRAADTAAHLVDAVLPHVPLRQWVLALPPDLHARVSRDPALESGLLRIFADELEGLLRATTKAFDRGRGGNVTFVQHFGSTLNLHVHFHTLALDGVYVPGPGDDGAPVFVPAPEPTPEQVRWLCEQVAIRARRLVERRPWQKPPEERVTPLFKVVGEPPKPAENKRLHARVDGFDLHASTAFAADQRLSVERFCRYALRGPIANGRLSSGPRDLLTYHLKAPKPDGTTQLVLSPMTLLERLARLVPAPRLHLTRYFGVLSNAARWRKHIVPKPRDSSAIPLLKRGGRWLDWASLLRRVFLAEVLACGCGGTRRVIAAIEPGPTCRKILRHLGLPASGPELAAARLDQADFWATGPPSDPDCDPPWIDDVQRSPPDFAA